MSNVARIFKKVSHRYNAVWILNVIPEVCMKQDVIVTDNINRFMTEVEVVLINIQHCKLLLNLEQPHPKDSFQCLMVL